PNTVSPLSRVSAAGGTPEVVSTLDVEAGEASHRWPEVLPGGQAVLFTAFFSGSESNVVVLTLETGEAKTVIQSGTHARYVETGHLVYGSVDGSLLAVPFDLKRLEVTGPPVSLLEGLMVKPTLAAEFAISPNGSLVYLAGELADLSLVTVDRQGVEQILLEGLRLPEAPRFSPDGGRIALAVEEGGNRDIWIYEMEQGTLSRLTFEGDNRYPVWTPAGDRVHFTTDRVSTDRDLFWRLADGSGAAELLLTHEGQVWEGAWSPDAKWLAFRAIGPTTGRDLYVLPLEGDGTARTYLQTTFDERSPAISPDGRWLAYASNEAGRDEVYVRAFPEPGGRWQVSADGGTEPLWAPSGRELFYRDDDKFVAVAIETEPVFRTGAREVLFEGAFVANSSHANYDISPDGERFVLIKGSEESNQLVIVLNWFEELRRRMER
ncbi:MAG: hypothetical protein Q8W48_05485, partial [Candidatus Palauibacterales bacterium]|nr:hypothetical protein [Candidatus Palauibacterales bacterium]